MRLFRTVFLFLIFCYARPATAQGKRDLAAMARGARNLQPEAKDENGLPANRYLTNIPFRLLTGGIILAKVRIGDLPDSLNFIFDTGSGGISMDSSTAGRFHFVPQTTAYFVRGIAGMQPQRLLEDMTLGMGGITLDSLTMQVSNYDLLSSIYGESIDGIVGYSFFSRYIVKVDYDSSKMYVYSKGDVTYPPGGFLLRPRVVGLPVLEGQLNDARDIVSRFFFDTGAGLCLLLSSNFATDSVVFGPKRKKPVPAEGAGLGGKKEMQLTTLKTFTLGPFHFRQVPTYIFDDSYDVTSYPQLAGLIGNDLLRRFNLIVNYARSEIYITPNSAFRQPFDYSYSGISIALIDGKIIVTDVMTGSPGQTAGFREGDVIMMINGDGRQDIQTYQGYLRTVGPRVKVLVRRTEGELVILSLKVKSIL